MISFKYRLEQWKDVSGTRYVKRSATPECDTERPIMVGNLMTVLCAESEVQPVINTGTLYS